MGKRPAEDELFVGNMGSIQWEIRSSMQRENSLTMETGLERIAEKARSEPRLRFTSLAHHITRERVWMNLCQIPKRSAPGVDGQTVTEAKERFGEWVTTCSNPFTARDIEHRTSDAYISQNPASRKSARWVFPALMIGRSSAAPPRYCRPYMRRTFYRVRLVAGLNEEPIKPWPPSMR